MPKRILFSRLFFKKIKQTLIFIVFALCLYSCGNNNEEKPYTFNPEEETRISDSILAKRKITEMNIVDKNKKRILRNDSIRTMNNRKNPLLKRKRIAEDSMFRINYPNAALLKDYLKKKRLKDFIKEENWNKIIKGIKKNDRVYLIIKDRDVDAEVFFGGGNLIIYNCKSHVDFFEKKDLLCFTGINNFVKWEINPK